MSETVVTCLVLVLLLACCLLASCLGLGFLVWQMEEPDGMSSAPPVPPAATLPPSGPVSATALETEARLNAAVVPIHDPIALRAVLAPDSLPSEKLSSAPHYTVGDRRSFDLGSSTDEAELIHVTEHTYVWLVEGVDADRQDLIAAGERFEREIYPVVRRYFGSEWTPGVDGDVRLSILHYEDPDDNAAGYFSPGDELPRWIDSSSNEMEMFYVNLSSMDPDEEFYFAVLAHEFQHMIHWHNDRNEADWLDEGLAELACRVAGLDPGSSNESFLRHPDTQLNRWPDEDDPDVNYGASYLFALYLWERFGDELIWDLIHYPGDGMAGLDEVLAARGMGVTADELFAEWVIVNALNEGAYAYRHEDSRVVLGVETRHDRYPAGAQETVYPYATDYIELNGSGRLQIHFRGTPEADLLPVTPHTGERMWWSNRGDRSNARLAHHFDLTGLSRATLRFWTWYDLEARYDYVYLSISTDGGRTWEVLDGERATRRGEYGPAYNGQSSGWVEEQVDLSPYAGGEVWLRFDYVTDDSINHPGFLIDDVSIPELNFFDGCDDAGAWEAEGFVLVGQRVPQRWLVQVIEYPPGGGPARVRRLDLDDAQSGQMELELGGEVEKAWLVISALARGVTEPAPYWYEVSPP